MPRNVTVTLANGTTHTYRNVADNVTPDQVEQRAAKDFPGQRVTNISGGRKSAPAKPKNPPSRLAAFGAGVAEALPRAIGGIIEFLDPQGRKLLTPEQQRAYDAQFAKTRQQRPNAFTAGQVTGEVLATAPVVSGGGKILEKTGEAAVKIAPKFGAGARVVKRGGRIVQQGGRAVQSGGTGVRAPGRAAVTRGAPVAATRTGRMALRVAGGGGSAAATAAMTDQDVLDAAAAGAVVPVAGTIARKGIGWTYDFLAGRLGELRAAEIMRNVIADKSSGIIDALKNAPKNVKANTAEFLAAKGLLTPELAAATRIVSASKFSKPLEQVAKARVEAQDETRAFIRGGNTQTEAMGNIAVSKQAIRDATAPMREENLMLADIGRTQIIPAEREAGRLRTGVQRELDTAARFMDQPDWSSSVQQRLVDARSAEEIAANLRAQGLQPLDITPIVTRLRTEADNARFVNPARERVLTGFADNLEARARDKGGVIDALGLYELRKNMGNVVADLLGPTDPKALQTATAQIIGETQPLIDEAITAAGGRGWKTYLDTFAQGMRNVERSQFERKLTTLPEARYTKIMAGEDPDFVKDFFGPGRFDINVELMGPKLPAAHQLAGDIMASRAVQQGGLGDLSPSQRLSLPTGARVRVQEAMTPGLNTFARTMANITGRIPGLSGGGLAAERIEEILSNKMAERTMRELAPALADPALASRLLETGPSGQEYLGMALEKLAPQTRNFMTRLLSQSFIRPSYSPNQ